MDIITHIKSLITPFYFLSTADTKYSMTSYVNGQLDIDMKYSDVVLGNDCPLHLFKDISHDGKIINSCF